jgi:hypothetical protein
MVLKEALLYMIQGFMGGPPTDLKNMVNFRSEKSGICGVKDVIHAETRKTKHVVFLHY